MSRFLGAFTADLVELELAPLPDGVAERTRGWVQDRVGGANQTTRAGIATTGLLLGAGVLVATGRPYERLPEARRLAIARRLAASRLPIVAEYVKAVRSLAVAYAFEAQYASAP